MSNSGKSDSDTPDFSFLAGQPEHDAAAEFQLPQDEGEADTGAVDFSTVDSAAVPNAPDLAAPDLAATDGTIEEPDRVTAEEPTADPAAADAADMEVPTAPASKPTTRKMKRSTRSTDSAPAASAASKARRRGAVDPTPADTSSPSGEAGAQAADGDPAAEPTVPRRSFVMVAGYAAALTLLFILFWLTGRLQLSGRHPLESLPDIKPLQPGEFQKIPEEAALPPLHDLQLGETRRFGDIEITPTRVTREVLTASNPARRNSTAEPQTSGPVLKLWFTAKNVSDEAVFAPWDLGLMCLRSPEYSVADSTLANSWLKADPESDAPKRILNYMHPPGSVIQLSDQNSGRKLKPGEAAEFYVACAEDVQHLALDSVDRFQWRIQIRKGISQSGNGVTTMVDFFFGPDQIEVPSEENASA